MPCPLNNLPDEVWLDNILPFVEIPGKSPPPPSLAFSANPANDTDLLSLSLVNRHLHDVASDNILWLRRIRCDFNVPPSVTARQDGWKELYGALRRPVRTTSSRDPASRLSHVGRETSISKDPMLSLFSQTLYVWGETSNSRLGLPRTHPALATFHASYNGVNAPARLELDPSVGMVDIQASGFGFVGLDSGGRIWVWGTLRFPLVVPEGSRNWLILYIVHRRP